MNIIRSLQVGLPSPAPLTKVKRTFVSLPPLKWPEEPLDLPSNQRGGFYPAKVGEKLGLHSRYTIIRKLGWGRHSSVWLARDEQGVPEQPYVSIKILSAHATSMHNQGVSNELAVLRRIHDTASRSTSPSNPGHRHILTLLDHFEFSSALGRHLCLVQQPMGLLPTLKTLKGGFGLLVAKSIIKQLLAALSFLHDECHVVHTDIKPDNILVDLAEPVQIYLPGHLEEPTAPASHGSILPDTAPLSSPLHVFGLKELEEMEKRSKFSIKLTDFGIAAALDGHHAEIIQPYALRAPEVIIGCGWDTRADIWNLGCLAFELLTGRWLFVPRAGPTWTAEVYHLAHMPAIAGEEFDVSYFRQGRRYTEYFDDDGTLRLQVEGVVNLEGALKSYGVLPETELQPCVAFLRSMLRLNPSDRATAYELSHHPWLTS